MPAEGERTWGGELGVQQVTEGLAQGSHGGEEGRSGCTLKAEGLTRAERAKGPAPWAQVAGANLAHIQHNFF